MSELKAYIGPHPTDHTLTEYYLKSEADKVIAEKDEEIAELKEQVHDYALGLYVIQAKAEKEASHANYKRCLAMAKWCENRNVSLYSIVENNLWEYTSNYWLRWRNKWLALAEKFKEAK